MRNTFDGTITHTGNVFNVVILLKENGQPKAKGNC